MNEDVKKAFYIGEKLELLISRDYEQGIDIEDGDDPCTYWHWPGNVVRGSLTKDPFVGWLCSENGIAHLKSKMIDKGYEYHIHYNTVCKGFSSSFEQSEHGYYGESMEAGNEHEAIIRAVYIALKMEETDD